MAEKQYNWVFPVLGAFVGIAVVGVFVWITVGAAITANEPPRQADVAPTSQPMLLCEPAALTSPATSSPTASPGAVAPSNEATSSPDGTQQVLECSADQAAYAPQYRGSFDPNSRYLALLAIVTPLLTTLVAFYFGEKAGAAKGQAEARSVAGRTAAINTKDPEALQKLERFQQELKDGGKL